MAIFHSKIVNVKLIEKRQPFGGLFRYNQAVNSPNHCMKENDTYHSPSLFRFLLAFIVVLGSSSLLNAQLVSPFTIRHQTQQKGGIRFISNVSVTCNSSTSCTNAQAQIPPSGTGQNNSYTMSYVDIDSDPTTFMSSSDSLNLSNCSEKWFSVIK